MGGYEPSELSGRKRPDEAGYDSGAVKGSIDVDQDSKYPKRLRLSDYYYGVPGERVSRNCTVSGTVSV